MDITISTMIDTLYTLSSGSYGSRGKHLTAMLQSYHDYLSMEDEVYVTPDSVVSRMVHRCARRLPKPMHLYYVRTHPEHLREDIERYVASTVITAKQQHMHSIRIREMIDGAVNIDPADKRYIYTGNDNDTGTDLVDILYRAMWVLLHEP